VIVVVVIVIIPVSAVIVVIALCAAKFKTTHRHKHWRFTASQWHASRALSSTHIKWLILSDEEVRRHAKHRRKRQTLLRLLLRFVMLVLHFIHCAWYTILLPY